MNESEGKFAPNPEGGPDKDKKELEESETERTLLGWKKKKVLVARPDRTFIADDKGNVEQVGSGELKPHYIEHPSAYEPVYHEKERSAGDVKVSGAANQESKGVATKGEEEQDQKGHASESKDTIEKALEGSGYKVIEPKEEK